MFRMLSIFLLINAAAAPLAAQTAPDLNARVGKIEKELRAVQRKVFPGGQPLEAEIVAPTPAPEPAGSPATSPIADLTARVDAIEAQVRTLTGQAEQNAHRVDQLEAQVKQLAADAQARAAMPPLSAAASPAPPADQPAAAAASTPGIERPATGDAAEDGYLYGYRLWQAKSYPEAEIELKRVADTYPQHRRASFAQNLLGRAYLDEGKPALAAVALYDGYKKWPQGERAADSLYWLGQALTELKKPADACKVYAEFGDVYGKTASASLKAQVAAGKKRAKCS